MITRIAIVRDGGSTKAIKAQSSHKFCLMVDTVIIKSVHSLWKAQAIFTEAARQKANLSAQPHCLSWISFKCKMKTNSHTQEAVAQSILMFSMEASVQVSLSTCLSPLPNVFLQ